MFELLPVIAGGLFGVAWGHRAGLLLTAAFCVVIGVLVALLAGELAESVWFAALDTALAALGVVVGRAGAAVVAKRRRGGQDAPAHVR